MAVFLTFRRAKLESLKSIEPQRGRTHSDFTNAWSSLFSERNVHRHKPVSANTLDYVSQISTSRLNESGQNLLNYTRALVIPCVEEMEVSWVKKQLPEVEAVVYVVKGPDVALHTTPINKGHEVMAYLTYIIENYTNLPDISIFLHAHRYTRHNNELLGHDAVEMINRLRGDYVMEEGYVNLRCSWAPGCPRGLHMQNMRQVLEKQEEVVLSRCWNELFPLDPPPTFLGQPCCAQFALSRDRIWSKPLSQYVYYRDWILTTPLNDYFSGRIWEYSWHYVFTGNHTHCPAEQVCHCEAFGICFKGGFTYQDLNNIRQKKQAFEKELRQLQKNATRNRNQTSQKVTNSTIQFDKLSTLRIFHLSGQIEVLEKELNTRMKEAKNINKHRHD